MKKMVFVFLCVVPGLSYAMQNDGGNQGRESGSQLWIPRTNGYWHESQLQDAFQQWRTAGYQEGQQVGYRQGHEKGAQEGYQYALSQCMAFME